MDGELRVVTTWAILLAAGAGVRFGRGDSKAFAPLGGRPMLAHSLETIAGCGAIDAVVLVVSPADLDRGREVAAEVAGIRVQVVAGGATRQASVREGLAAVPPEAGVVVCHDAARPFASPELFRRVIGALDSAEGAVPVVPSTDTVKRVREGRVVETISRDEIGLAQTPQGFRASSLRSAHARAHASGLEATDDAMLVEAAGHTVVAVEGEATNFKITTPNDASLAERYLAVRAGRGG